MHAAVVSRLVCASEQRRALRLLASIPFGAARAVMRAHGFTRRTLADLVHAGLATAEHTTGKADRMTIEAG